MHEILRELDVNSNGLVELDEYLQVTNPNISFLYPLTCFDNLTDSELSFWWNPCINRLSVSLQLMACIKTGHVSNSRFAQLAEMEEEKQTLEEGKRERIAVERSGGGI